MSNAVFQPEQGSDYLGAAESGRCMARDTATPSEQGQSVNDLGALSLVLEMHVLNHVKVQANASYDDVAAYDYNSRTPPAYPRPNADKQQGEVFYGEASAGCDSQKGVFASALMVSGSHEDRFLEIRQGRRHVMVCNPEGWRPGEMDKSLQPSRVSYRQQFYPTERLFVSYKFYEDETSFNAALANYRATASIPKLAEGFGPRSNRILILRDPTTYDVKRYALDGEELEPWVAE